MRMILLYYKCTFALFIFRLHKLGIEAHAYAHYTSLLCFALLWWQQFLCIFIRINLNFCTNTRLLDCLAVAIVWVWGRSTHWGPGVKPLVSSGVTPIGQGWTNARGLRGLGGPKPDPKNVFFVYFNISSVRCQPSVLLYSWFFCERALRISSLFCV